eukprot:gene30485-37708_t
MVEIRVPYCPNLDVLDLPGIVANPPEAYTRTMELTNRVIAEEKAYSIFLLVVDSRTHANVSFATNLIVKNGVQAKTIGVLTKMDYYHYEGEVYDGTTLEEGFTQVSDALIADCPPDERLLRAEHEEGKLMKKSYSHLTTSEHDIDDEEEELESEEKIRVAVEIHQDK